VADQLADYDEACRYSDPDIQDDVTQRTQLRDLTYYC
jgi:hypothetical protein